MFEILTNRKLTMSLFLNNRADILTNFDEPCPGPCFSSACGVSTFENGISALNLTECIRRKTQLVTLRNDSFFFGMLCRFLSNKLGF